LAVANPVTVEVSCDDETYPYVPKELIPVAEFMYPALLRPAILEISCMKIYSLLFQDPLQLM